MKMVNSYHDLEVWRRGRALVSATYAVTRDFPKHELYGLSSQMQRASVSVPCNIAEGFSRRGTKDYIQYLSMAIGSLNELDTQSYLIEDLRYTLPDQVLPYRDTIVNLRRMLYAMRNKLRDQHA